jgi:hypothetical protein
MRSSGTLPRVSIGPEVALCSMLLEARWRRCVPLLGAKEGTEIPLAVAKIAGTVAAGPATDEVHEPNSRFATVHVAVACFPARLVLLQP